MYFAASAAVQVQCRVMKNGVTAIPGLRDKRNPRVRAGLLQRRGLPGVAGLPRLRRRSISPHRRYRLHRGATQRPGLGVKVPAPGKGRGPFLYTAEVTPKRAALASVYGAVLLLLAVPALDFSDSIVQYSQETTLQAAALIVIPSAALFHSVLSKRHSLAWSVYWTWSLVFLGLAASYQMMAGQFPWLGHLREEDISGAQRLILTGHLVALAVFAYVRTRRTPADQQGPVKLTESPRLKSAIITALLAHITMAAIFCAIMGPGMISGRAAYQARLLSYAGTPAFGTLYFLTVAGAIIIPAMAIFLRRSGLQIPAGTIATSALASFLVTNPLVGSRFLTGSFLVAVTAALLSGKGRRWLPMGVIAAFVTVFPTLDLLRGDGTGATEVAFTPPSETLTTFDYDSFEMIGREASLGGNLSGDVSRLDLIIAPFLRWVPFLSQEVQGHASGPAVARETGMGFTNVSMPLWAEADLFGSIAGVAIVFAIVGILLARAESTTLFGGLVEIPMAALLFIVLRGSLYEVLGYLLLAFTVASLFTLAQRKDRQAATRSAGAVHVPASALRIE